MSLGSQVLAVDASCAAVPGYRVHRGTHPSEDEGASISVRCHPPERVIEGVRDAV
jgi:hypothetical protein